MTWLVAIVIPIVTLLIFIFVLVTLYMIDKNTVTMINSLNDIKKIMLAYIRSKEEGSG